jgi:hypothetical protein
MPSLVKPIKYKDISDVDPYFNLISNINNHSIANIFCFRAFANKITGIVYNNYTGKFPFILLNGNVYFFVMYYYKTNTILATPLPGHNSNSILKVFKKNFKYLEEKGYKPKLNVIDNQATMVIKAYLTLQQVSLQLVKSHNHRNNTAERAFQMFKNTTNADFPI